MLHKTFLSTSIIQSFFLSRGLKAIWIIFTERKSRKCILNQCYHGQKTTMGWACLGQSLFKTSLFSYQHQFSPLIWELGLGPTPYCIGPNCIESSLSGWAIWSCICPRRPIWLMGCIGWAWLFEEQFVQILGLVLSPNGTYGLIVRPRITLL